MPLWDWKFDVTKFVAYSIVPKSIANSSVLKLIKDYNVLEYVIDFGFVPVLTRCCSGWILVICS